MESNWLKNSELAQHLGVSVATICNWKREGVIPRQIATADLKSLCTVLADKRKARANKMQSQKKFIPKEYLQGDVTEAKVLALLKMLSEVRGNRNKIALFANFLLWKNGEFQFSEGAGFRYRRAVVSKLMNDFCQRSWLFESYFSAFESLDISEHSDALGLLYQSLKKEGDKADGGSYYTPDAVVKDLLSSVEKKPKAALDPCCGSGSFLLGLARDFGLGLDTLFGVDVDEIAVFITRFNLLNFFPEAQVMPKVFVGDALKTKFHFDKALDLVISNPPWGAMKNSKCNRHYADLLNSSESFSMFILHSLSLLKPEGNLVFLLPESFLNIKSHRRIRQIVLKDNALISVSVFGRIFGNVLSKVIKVVVRKGSQEEQKVKVRIENGLAYEVEQKQFVQNHDFIINVYANEKDWKLLEKLDLVPHLTLEGHSQWALGIVTGNNSKFISDKPLEGYEKVFRGSDVDVMRMKKPSTYIHYERKGFQQVADDALFRVKEKLIYRFISQRLVFAFDDSQCLTLNSANILIPQIEGYDMMLIAAFLNSEAHQFLFQKRFSTHKVLQNDLKTLPFPILSASCKCDLTERLMNFLDGKVGFDMIDRKIYDAFGLDEDERDYIHRSVSK
jgi:Type I restriction-modification system methyltransferase subunit